LIRAGLKDGMTISTHHHFRDGDLVSNEIFNIAPGQVKTSVGSLQLLSLP
jgi:citrate lyase alpha subunit